LRTDDKEVDGPDIEAAEERRRQSELVEYKDDELHDLDGLPETFLEAGRTSEVVGAMRAILEGDHIVVNDLKLPKRQLVALEALKAAFEGKDSKLSRFVYAEDRRQLLEQALAVLQPELAALGHQGALFEELIGKVSTLREKLDHLEDSEEELIEGRVRLEEGHAGDTDDKDDDDKPSDKNDKKAAKKSGKKPKKKRGDDADKDRDLSLDGPERPVPPKGPSTLDQGPERRDEPKGDTTLLGGKAAEIERGPTTLSGGKAVELERGPTTLTGGKEAEIDRGPTTLGDEKEIAQAAASEPRWRRSDG
jgi:hypothetical protein